MKKILFFLPLLASSHMFAMQQAAVGESMGPDMTKIAGVLIINKAGEPVSFSVGYETLSSKPGKINSGEKCYYTPGRAFISGVIDSAGKFFPVKLYRIDGSEAKESVKYLKNRPGEVAFGAIQYDLTKENNQYVLRERQPGVRPAQRTSSGETVPERSTVFPALPVPPEPGVAVQKEEGKPQLSRPDPAPVRPDVQPVTK
jgi:hypothetical protein